MQKMQNGHVFMTNKEVAEKLGYKDSNNGNYGVFMIPKPVVKKAVPKGAASNILLIEDICDPQIKKIEEQLEWADTFKKGVVM